MRNRNGSLGGVSFFVGCTLALSACAGAGKHGEVLEALPTGDAVELRLKGDPGRVEKVKYYSRTIADAFQDGDIRNRKEEVVEFVAEAKTLAVQPEANRIVQEIKVTQKDGYVNLRAFAMPEEGETLRVVYSADGKILEAGDYPKTSLFFVPPISLPEKPVQVGDTWTMTADWISLEEGVPFHLEMVSILKGFRKCGQGAKCAEIEVSGDVRIKGDLAQILKFESHWQGRLLFGLDAGTMVWSRVRSQETFQADSVSRTVESCLESVLIEPESLMLKGFEKPKCDPSKPVENVSPSGIITGQPAGSSRSVALRRLSP